MIKYDNNTINKLATETTVNKMYYGGNVVYLAVNGEEPPTPSFQGKWLATYAGGTTSSAECGSSSVIIRNEITSTNLQTVEIGDCVTSIGQSAFARCSTITSVTIPNSVTTIGDGAFSECSALTSVTIPNSVTRIYEGAFEACTSLTSVIIGNSVTTIDGFVFWSCTSLTSITIPNSVTSIGDAVFSECSALTGVTVLATTPPTLGSDVFYDTNNCPIYVPAESLETYKTANIWSSLASRIQAIA